MRLAIALAAGAFLYLAIGYATGNGPRTPLRRSRPRAQVDAGQLWLIQAGLALTPPQFWAASALLGGGAFILFALSTGTPVVALVPAVVIGLTPRFVYARRRVQRLRLVQLAWPDGLRDLIAGVSAGMSLPQALVALATNGPPALQAAFVRFPTLSRMLGVVPALEVVREELADPTSDRVIEVLILAHERGGRLVTEVLRDLAEATTVDVRTSEEIATVALEQKINARAVFALPWLVLFFLTARQGPFRDFYQSPGGALVVAIAAVASLAGMWVVSRLSRDPVEERVLGGSARTSGSG